jgi:hypothetical protein
MLTLAKPRANDRRNRANQTPTILEGDERCGLEQIFHHQQVGSPVTNKRYPNKSVKLLYTPPFKEAIKMSP